MNIKLSEIINFSKVMKYCKIMYKTFKFFYHPSTILINNFVIKNKTKSTKL